MKPEFNKQLSERGQTLTGTLIAVGIVAILALAMASMISTHNRETRFLGDKLAALSLKNLLISALADGSVCLFEVNNPTVKTFDATDTSSLSASSISIPAIHSSYSAAAGLGPVVASAGSKASPDSENLWILDQNVGGIQLTNFVGSGSNYTADWIISFDNEKLVRALRPIVIPVRITANTTVPSQSTITGCMSAQSLEQNNCTWSAFSGTNNTSSNPGPSLCPQGKYVAGIDCNWMDTAGSDADQCRVYCCYP
jgi:hypothetical protein